MSEPRPVYPHPMLDARADGVVISRSVSPRLSLTPGRGDFLVSAARRERRAVLATADTAVLSEHLVRLLRETRSAWGVSDADGRAWDGMTGRVLHRPEAADGRTALGRTTCSAPTTSRSRIRHPSGCA